MKLLCKGKCAYCSLCKSIQEQQIALVKGNIRKVEEVNYHLLINTNQKRYIEMKPTDRKLTFSLVELLITSISCGRVLEVAKYSTAGS
jgi:hypothetical protein